LLILPVSGKPGNKARLVFSGTGIRDLFENQYEGYKARMGYHENFQSTCKPDNLIMNFDG